MVIVVLKKKMNFQALVGRSGVTRQPGSTSEVRDMNGNQVSPSRKGQKKAQVESSSRVAAFSYIVL